MQNIYCSDTGHSRSTIKQRQALPDMDAQWCEPGGCIYLSGRQYLALILEVALAYKPQGQMCQLHQIAAGSYPTMLIDARIGFSVDKVFHQLYQIRMDTGVCSEHGIQSGQEQGSALLWCEQRTHTRTMTSDKIEL